ncbi:MAG: hypothetical protein HQK49_07475 [Oligoflexia bacterium]|nr:hypothetical protein [Oligoflexia bacterium]
MKRADCPICACSSRIIIFLRERCLLMANLGLSLLSALGLYYANALIFNKTTNILLWESLSKILLVTLVSFLFLVLLRIADEFKDIESDKVLFPNRCLPAGRVKYSDVTILAVIALIVFIIINLIFTKSLILFLALMIYAFLFYKYFFLPKLISNNLLLALITHNPITFVFHLYLFSFFTDNPFATESLLIAVVMWISGLSWEVSRKIRVEGDETDYVTYSKIFGVRKAAVVPLLALAVQAGILIFLIPKIIYIILCVYVLYLLSILNFICWPSSKKASKLELLTEIYVTLIILFVIAIGIGVGVGVII